MCLLSMIFNSNTESVYKNIRSIKLQILGDSNGSYVYSVSSVYGVSGVYI